MNGIISIQPQADQVFAMQRLGFPVWTINTTKLCSDTCKLTNLITDIHSANCDYNSVVSGMLDTVQHVNAVKYILDRTSGSYFCDIAMTAETSHEVVDALETLVHLADVVTLTPYELTRLTGDVITDVVTCIEAINSLKELCEVQGRPPVILVKCIEFNDQMHSMIMSNNDGDYLAQRPLLSFDEKLDSERTLVSAVFAANYLEFGNSHLAFELTHNSVADIVATTRRMGNTELQVIAAQDRLVMPESSFTITTL